MLQDALISYSTFAENRTQLKTSFCPGSKADCAISVTTTIHLLVQWSI